MREVKICLLIDDDPLNQVIFQRALCQVSSRTICFTAGDCMEALDLLNKDGIAPDFIFVELNLPRIDGIQFFLKIRKNVSLRRVPVVVHSSTLTPERIQFLKRIGFHAIHHKRYTLSGLASMMRMYFEPSIAVIHQN